jgi:hypothetical protein
VVMGLVYSVLAAPTEEDRAGAAFIASRLSGVTRPAGVWAGRPAPEAAAGHGGEPGSGSVASRFARRGPAAPAGGGAPAGSGFVPIGGTAADGVGTAGQASGASGGTGPAGGSVGGGFGAYGGVAPPVRPQPGDPAPSGLGASLRETESFTDGQSSDGGRWAGLTERTHPAPRPISEWQYAGGDNPPGAQPMEPPAPLPRRAGERGALPQRNTREPWTPSPTPTRHE